MIDRYTKTVLTLIAGALLVLAGQGFLRPATAQSGPVHVVVDLVASFALQFAGPLEVRGR